MSKRKRDPRYSSFYAATELAEICERMTGDETRVVKEGTEIYAAWRYTGSEWVPV